MEAFIWPVLLALIIGVLPFVLDRGRITPVGLAVFRLCKLCVGYAVFDLLEGVTVWPYFGLGLLALLFGAYGFRRISTRNIRLGDALLYHGRQDRFKIPMLSDTGVRQLKVFCALVGLFVVYHFAVGGIPVLKSNVEIARFEFTSSGLFGIPGRMTLYGWPFVVLCVSLYYWRTEDPRLKTFHYAVWITFFIIGFMGGFKSSLLAVLNLFVISRALAGKPLHLRQAFSRKAIILLVIVAVYAVWVTSRYASLGVATFASTSTYMKMRIAAIPSQPGHYAITNLTRPHSPPYFVQDTLYFVGKYTGVCLGEEMFPLDKIVSSSLYGVPLAEENWIVPVTVGAFAQWAADLQIWGAIIAMAILGVIIGYSAKRSSSSAGIFSAAFWALLLDRMLAYLGQGNFAHMVINFAAVIVILTLLKVAASAIASASLSDTSGISRPSLQEP